MPAASRKWNLPAKQRNRRSATYAFLSGCARHNEIQATFHPGLKTEDSLPLINTLQTIHPFLTGLGFHWNRHAFRLRGARNRAPWPTESTEGKENGNNSSQLPIARSCRPCRGISALGTLEPDPAAEALSISRIEIRSNSVRISLSGCPHRHLSFADCPTASVPHPFRFFLRKGWETTDLNSRPLSPTHHQSLCPIHFA
jgi:hypothetical protein